MGWGDFNFTEAAGNAGSWTSDMADQAGDKAREWLATTSMEPAEREECFKAFRHAFTDLLKCTAQYPNQWDNQLQERCACWFKMHRRLEEADCEDWSHNYETGSTAMSDANGQISIDQSPDFAEQCKPYYDAWLAANPEPTLLQLFWDRVCLFFQENPVIAALFVLLLLVLVALLVLKCMRKTPRGQSLLSDFAETRQQLYEATIGGNKYGDFVDDEPESFKEGGNNKAPSREVFAMQAANDSSQRQVLSRESSSEDTADFGEQRTSTAFGSRNESKSKANRPLKVYDDGSEPEDEEEWQGIGYVFSTLGSLFSPKKEETDSEEVHYHMVREGPSLAELRLQRRAEEEGVSVDELQQREQRMKQARAAEPPATSSALPAAAVASQYHSPPYYNVHSSSPGGHHVVHANPEVLQSAATRTAPPVMLPAIPQNVNVPFPHHRAYGTASPLGRGAVSPVSPPGFWA